MHRTVIAALALALLSGAGARAQNGTPAERFEKIRKGFEASERAYVEKLRGAAKYVDDHAIDGCLHGVTFRSSIACGRIRRLTLDPGFPWHEYVVVGADDIPGENAVALIEHDQPLLAKTEIRHPMEPILLIAHPHRAKAYAALDQETKDLIEPLICEHSQMFSRAKLGFTDFTPDERERFKPVRQRLVRVHPSTGRKSLYLSSHAGTILGWPDPEAKALLMDLTEAATQREFVYSHKWRVGDLVMWDNRATMHRARPFPHDEPRDVRRTTLMGDAPTVAQQAA